MDDARRRAWAALGIGPAWLLRDAPRPVVDGPDAPVAADGTSDVGEPPMTGPGRQDATDGVVAEAVDGGKVDGGKVDGGEVEGGEVAVARSRAPSERRDPVIARLDWPTLGAAVSDCHACGLCEGRRNTVFGVGPRPASWMLVGEAPGEQEDLRGEPFVGPAGRLLDQMLAAIAVDRSSEAFIANVLKCRPPRNRDPQPEEVARCEPYLLRQVELLQPRLIVVLGRFAAQSLLRTDATIASLRGRVHRYRAGDREVPMIVTYHPAYLLRNLPDKARAWADLRLARRTYDAADGSR